MEVAARTRSQHGPACSDASNDERRARDDISSDLDGDPAHNLSGGLLEAHCVARARTQP
jgi:hypothetical protein